MATHETKRRNVLPGFGLTLGFTLAYLGLIVLIPLSTIFFKTAPWAGPSSGRRHLAARDGGLRTELRRFDGGALINSVFGFIGRVGAGALRISRPSGCIDALVDLPFALPTAVAGITLTALYASNGWIGRWLRAVRNQGRLFTPLGVIVALTFIGLPFVVRTVQPVLEDLEPELEEAAATLGASRLQTFLA